MEKFRIQKWEIQIGDYMRMKTIKSWKVKTMIWKTENQKKAKNQTWNSLVEIEKREKKLSVKNDNMMVKYKY